MHSESGAAGTYTKTGANFYKKKAGTAPAVTTKAPATGGGLAAYDAPLADRKGRYKKGGGNYKVLNNVATAAACATLCSSVDHGTKCFAFSHDGGTTCTMHSESGAAGTYTQTGASFYKKKPSSGPNPVTTKPAVVPNCGAGGEQGLGAVPCSHPDHGFDFNTGERCPDLSASSALDKFASPVADAKGRFKKGAGLYRTDAAKADASGAKTAEACAKVCTATAHAAGCFGFAFKSTSKVCEMYSDTGSENGAYTAESTSGWSWYKKN